MCPLAPLCLQYVSEGFDCHEIDGVLIADPMTSRTRITQLIGRCMRVSRSFPDKAPLVFLPVHDPEALYDSEQLSAALDELAVAAPEDAAGDVRLPFTPFQAARDCIRKVLECMGDPAVRCIMTVFEQRAVRSRAYNERPAIRGTMKDVLLAMVSSHRSVPCSAEHL